MGSAMGGLAAGKESRQKAPGYHLPVGLRISPLSGVRFEPPLEREQEYLLGLLSRLGREARELLANEFGVSEEAIERSLLEEDRSPEGERIRQEVVHHPVLHHLWTQVAAGIEARAALVEANIDLVRYAVYKLGYGRGPYEERVAGGFVGLLKAADRYDPAEGTRFSTYALNWIRHATKRHSLEETAVHVPVHAWQNDQEEIQNALKAARFYLSLDAPMGEEEDTLLGDLFSSPYPQPEEWGERRWLEERVRGAIESLDGREREVVARRFGLGGGEEETLREIADTFGVSRERVRQVEAKALKKLEELLRPLEAEIAP